jgi:thiamine pyrophosphate-dependent acetolactate synthase large subunit-like protein
MPHCGIVADVRATLEMLLPLLPETPRPAWTAIPPNPEPPRLPGLDLIAPLRKLLPPDGTLAADVTRLAYILMLDFPLEQSRCFLHPVGAVSMGYGIPAALAARVAFPDRKIVAVVGDGGFLMSGMELATAVQEKLPIVVILINDSTLTLIKATQQRRYAGRFIGVDLQNPDFAMFAGAFGVHYARADTDEAFEVALSQALAEEHTTLIEVRPGG